MTDHSTISDETRSRLGEAVAGGAYLMLAGPTAAGKSALAKEIALQTEGVIINADSMQLYRDLRVLTARPSSEDEALVPHRLYGVVDGGTRASVAHWLEMAGREVAEARAAGRLPILVGGTGMYLGAALDGIAPIPEVPDGIHRTLLAELAERGGAAMRVELAAHDPATAARLSDGDSQRLVRALGVHRATGRSISSWQEEPHEGAIGGKAMTVALLPPRDAVYEAIDGRFERMMRAGAIEEVGRLAERRLDPGLPVMKALGVREIMALGRGEMDRERATELASRDTRRYAKRQFTWINNNYDAKAVVEGKFADLDPHGIVSAMFQLC